ncbi:glutathione synthetase ATP-binding domain-like protein [Ascosphaera pollenicola]|nr:glutathione synthetase ATP-binding domain-like protein [Ascosphaera pollenicola]
MYYIQGRTSIDIIKSGGEKISALEVERELLSLPEIAEAAVVGLPSDKFGSIVAAAITLTPAAAAAVERGETKFGFLAVRNALQGKLAKYKIPKKVKVVEKIPRNAMGKILKKQIVKEIFGVE